MFDDVFGLGNVVTLVGVFAGVLFVIGIAIPTHRGDAHLPRKRRNPQTKEW